MGDSVAMLKSLTHKWINFIFQILNQGSKLAKVEDCSVLFHNFSGLFEFLHFFKQLLLLLLLVEVNCWL